MRLTTLGTGTIALSPQRACAGHLVEIPDAGVRLLLDCGSGVAQRLAALHAEGGPDWLDITHLALTHFHADHVGDLPTLFAAWRNGRRPARSAPLTVLGPPGLRALIERLGLAYGQWIPRPDFPLAVVQLGDPGAARLGEGVLLSARKVPHSDASVAYSIEYAGRRIVYTGDTGYDPGLAAWGSGCDVLLCECSFPDTHAMDTHLTPRQCGAMAAIARPGLLALTHLYPQVEGVDIRAQVAERFQGSVEVAADGWTIEIEDMQCWS